ncbi:MAG: MBL fold metallo-hydrolase [Bacteroidales bacterium]|nr:MBL fold metallo-hydrolase [Bacteroidales bacterium]
MERIFKMILLAALAFAAAACYRELPFPDDEEEKTFEQLPSWQKGYMDIHQISTGRGNCTFMILPDGTTMMVDAGDLGSGSFKQEIMSRVPYTSRTPGEWIVRYASHFLEDAGLPSDKLDYMLVTHFHNDHIGTPADYSLPSNNGKYFMTGVSHVGNFLNIEDFIDRGYPDYNFPYAGVIDNAMMDNYMAFLNDDANLIVNRSAFEVGSAGQFVLKNAPQDYPSFSIRNIYCNGRIWTGEGGTTENLVPDGVDQNTLSDENLWSAVINVNYGDFDYHSGADILGGYGDWRNVESKVGKLIGETDVVLCNHHAYKDAMNADMVNSTKPQAYVIPVWDYYHPEEAPLARMMSNPESMVFAAGLVESNRTRLLENGERIKPEGHIVVRVYEGGSEFQVYVLNDRNTDYDVLYKTERITSNK